MIYPQKNKFIKWFFHHYILRIVKRNFEEVRFNNVELSADKSVLLLANHFSWWDGFLMYYLNYKLFKKRFYIMVKEETVKEVRFIKYMGAFSVNKGSRDMITSLNYAADLLQNPNNLVVIFPQGKLYSNLITDIAFEKGLSKVIEKAAGRYQTVLSATFVENFQYKKPSAHVYLQTLAEQIGGDNVVNLQQAYQQHYDQARLQQTKITV